MFIPLTRSNPLQLFIEEKKSQIGLTQIDEKDAVKNKRREYQRSETDPNKYKNPKERNNHT